MWFGTIERYLDIPAALTELPADWADYNSLIQYSNGGGDVDRSFASHKTFAYSAKGDMSLIGLIEDYASGYYGNGLIHMSFEHSMRRNMFAKNWASPRIIEVGDWPDLADDGAGNSIPGSFADTAGLTYLDPKRTVTYDLAAQTADPRRRFVLPIPPDRTLHLGWKGAASGNGAIRVRPIKPDGTYDSTTDLTPLATSSSTRFNASFAGSSYVAVEVYLKLTAAGAGTVSITSLIAQATKGSSFTTTGNHQPGRGYSGFKFASSPSVTITRDPADASRERMTLAATFVEVGLWMPLSR